MELSEGDLLGAASVLGFTAAWLQAGPIWGWRVGYWCLGTRRRGAARWVVRWLRFIPWGRGNLVASDLRIRIAADEGDTATAIRILEELLGKMPVRSERARIWSTRFVDVWVTAGRYRTAVLEPRRARWQMRPRPDREGLGIAQVNRAEALHNLGHDRLALRLLARWRSRLKSSPLGRNGAITLRAWILASLGKTEKARTVFAQLDPKPLSPYYRAEVCFTHAAIELSAGQLDRALASASEGLAHSVRASSERNACYLLGRIEIARGNLDAALTHYERGRSHRYRGQGGGGLLELGKLYERLNQSEAARRAYEDAVERDPESVAAAVCRDLLADPRYRSNLPAASG